MKLKAFAERIKELCKKAGMKTLIAICAFAVLVGAVTLNFILSDKSDTATGKIGFDLASSADDSNGTTLEVDAVKDYFASISLQRKQARDEAKEVLMTVAESPTAITEVKETAMTDISKLAAEIEQEANIESLILSKGFTQCVAVISDDKCSVIVESNGLLPGECAQISEIVYEQSGIIPENLKIIEKAS